MTIETPFCQSCGSGAVVSGFCSTCGQRQKGSEAEQRPPRRRKARAHTHSPPRYVPPPADGDLTLRMATPSQTQMTSERARDLLLRELRRLGEAGERCEVEGGCQGHASDERLSELTGISKTTVPARRGELQDEGKIVRYGSVPTASGGRAELNHLIEAAP